MKGIFKLLSFTVFPVVFGCTMQPSAELDANGVIRWSSGEEERVNVSSSNEHLIFINPSFLNQQVVIYSRIIGAGTDECEFYVNEPSPNVRLTLCRDGDLELIIKGKTVNVGRLEVFDATPQM